MDLYSRTGTVVADARADERTTFLRRTYSHLGLAVVAFVGIEMLLLQIPGIEKVVRAMTGMGWLLVLGLFILVSYVADSWARHQTSLKMQYAGLGLYVVAEAIIFLPLLFLATRYGGPGVLADAATLTLITFGGLSAIVWFSGSDFSYLGTGLRFAGLLALGLIVCAILFGFTLGTWFTVAMIVFASAAILYHTGAVLHRYRSDQYVSASLSLFAAVALLFWYILQLLMSLRRN